MLRGHNEIKRSYSADLDYDGDVDESDRQRFFQAFGRQRGEPGFLDAADFDRDGIPSLVDYQTWRQALVDFNTPPSVCGLIGIEPLLLLGALGVARRRARRRTKESPAMRSLILLLAVALTGLAAPDPASALSSVRVEAPALSPDIGASFDVLILADLSEWAVTCS